MTRFGRSPIPPLSVSQTHFYLEKEKDSIAAQLSDGRSVGGAVGWLEPNNPVTASDSLIHPHSFEVQQHAASS